MGGIADAMAALDKDSLLAEVKSEIEARRDPLEIVEEARKGLEHVGLEFEKGSYFLMELMWASQIFKDAMELIGPEIKKKHGSAQAKGRVLMGTVKGDIHDLGKSIVRDLLTAAGYDVVDLGVDVPPEAFVERINTFQPQVLGLSALLTAAVSQAAVTVEDLKKAGLRDKLKVIMGGGVVGEIKVSEFGVDFATNNANEGIRVMEKWVAEAKR
jgi:methylmalonyl-CoA mutase cobalamin-binding domain/chain